MNYALHTGCGDFLNAEGAKVSQRAQKKMEKGIPKILKRLSTGILLKLNFVFNFSFFFVFNFVFFFVFFLRSLRNLRALCVQKLPFPSSSPSTVRAASNL
jgi:hypothetical protein